MILQGIQDKLLKPEADKIKYYIYYYARNDQELKNFYEYLKELHEIVNDDICYIRTLVACDTNVSEKIPSCLASVYRKNLTEEQEQNSSWYSDSYGLDRGGYFIKFKSDNKLCLKDFDPEKLIKYCDSVRNFYDSKEVLIVKNNVPRQGTDGTN